MTKIGIRLLSGELRLVNNADSFSVNDDFIVYEDEDCQHCSKILLLPSTLIIERGDIKTVNYIRDASNADKSQLLNKRSEEKKAFDMCKNKISSHNLPMRLIDAVYTFDFNRLTFFFSAQGRVDFRKLLKDLTSTFRRTRILLRQIGAREEARLFSGVGTCGRSLCCSTWLNSFPFVTMKMAKNQNLPPNPSKLTGVCGKLKCCLSYEEQMYIEEKKDLPAIGSFVESTEGIAEVVKHLPISKDVGVIFYDTGKYGEINLADIITFNIPSPKQFEADFDELDEL